MQCSVCAKPEADVTGKLLLCSKCKATAYCCKKCQRSDAKSHKKVCGLLNKGIGSTDAVAQASACFVFVFFSFWLLFGSGKLALRISYLCAAKQSS